MSIINKIKLLNHSKQAITFIIIFILISISVDLWRSRYIDRETIPYDVLSTLRGDMININEMSEDKPVLIYFWATWCSVCGLVSPSVDWLSASQQVVSIAITSGPEKRLKQYMQHKGYHFSVINDEKGLISRQWGVTATPTVFIVNKGEIASITIGASTPIGLWLRLFFA